jgi:superfamily II DNA or RNA helicase
MIDPIERRQVLTPRPYQQEGIDFLRETRRAMLLDAAGLGKTLQAAMAAETPCLICAPTYLTEQWAEFLENQFPGSRVSLCDGDQIMRQAGLLVKADWYIINHDMLPRYTMPYVKTVIIDESHHFKNRNAKRAKAAEELVYRPTVKNVYLLTATPIKRETDDLYMQLRLLDRGQFSSYWRFVDQYCKSFDYGYGSKVYGSKATAELRSRLTKWAMGRTYKEVGLYLPELIPNVVKVSMDDAFRNAYREMKVWGLAQLAEAGGYLKVSETQAKNIINALRRMTAAYLPKTKTIQGLVEDAYDEAPDRPIVTFTWFRETAQALGEALDAREVITGEMLAIERTRRAKGVKSGAVVATLASLSEGVDLSHSRTVVFAEEDYTPGAMNQAVWRVQRWSKSESPEPVVAYYVHVKDSIDEIIHNIQVRRGGTARDVLSLALRGA